jgi:hypothetical protein
VELAVGFGNQGFSGTSGIQKCFGAMAMVYLLPAIDAGGAVVSVADDGVDVIR